MKFHKAPIGFSANDRNPFTPDGAYGFSWSGFFLLDRNDAFSFIGKSKTGLFSYQFGRKVPNLEQRLADFLRYEAEHGRNVILCFPEGVDVDGLAKQALDDTPLPHIVRDSDSQYMVHSTTREAGGKILVDGMIKCLSGLAKEGTEVKSLGCISLGEPPEYADHICLGSMDMPGPEMVVGSNTQGRFITEDEAYEPGLRFYFDCHSIIRAGLDVRVAGAIKVFGALPLQPYLVMTLGLADIDPDAEGEHWTPRLFTKRANDVFWDRVRSERDYSQ